MRALRIGWLLLFVCATAAAATLHLPPLTGRVVDAADILPPEVQTRLNALLAQHEAASHQQVVVATVPSLGGQAIEDYGVALGRAWGIGQRKENTGAILLVAPKEHTVRIEVGYGLEGVLTDAVSAQIINEQIVPAFRKGDLAGGVENGTRAILAALGDPAAAAAAAEQKRKDGAPGFSPLLMLLIVVWVLFSGLTRRRGLLGGGGWGGGGWGGGGGGGGGGFSGGGGSFGGGGASGRW